LFAIVAATYAYVISSNPKVEKENNNTTTNNTTNSGNVITNLFGPKQIKTNVAVFGADKGGSRTDVMFVVTFDSETKKIGVLSVPRDTRVTMTDEMQKELKALGKFIPNKGVAKINEVHAYAPNDKRNEYSVMQLENLLNINIDYYVKIDLDGFKKVIDDFGGVDFEVAQNLDYEDPYQDLYIHLKKGMQHLDGAGAEQLVRFRHYPQGDVARVEVQQLFLKELAKKILNTNNIINNLPGLTKTFFTYVKTDIGIDDALKYVKYVKEVNTDNITMKVLPGSGQYVGEVSYFLHDAVETRKVVDELFYNIKEEEETTTTAATSSKDKKIEVLNGSTVGGIAARTQDKLLKAGYNVTSIGNYEGAKKTQTVIIVGQQGLGHDLQQYFSDSVVQVDAKAISAGSDIKIILGTAEK
jgi:LCP family protein required for cell wall assembly